MLLTVELALLSLLVAMVLGMIAAVAKLSRSRLANGIASVYTTIVRALTST